MAFTIKFCCLPLLCYLTVLPGWQDDTDMQRRRFKQAINAYLSRSKAKATLADVLTERAKAQNLKDTQLQALQAKYKDAISAFVEDQAANWVAVKQAPALFRAHSESLTRSTYFIEISKPWRAMLEEILTEEELKAWTTNRKAALSYEAEQMEQAAARAAAEKLNKQRQQEAQATAFAQQIVAQDVDEAQLRSSRNRLLEYCRALLEASQRNGKERLMSDVVWMDELFQLNARQKRKLELAVSGVTRRLVRESMAAVAEMESKPPTSDEAIDAQIRKILTIYKKFAPPLTRMRAAMRPREPYTHLNFLTDDTLWQKALQSTLTDEQLQSFEAEQTDRRAFRKDVDVRQIVRSFDYVLRLRSEQRKALIKLLHEEDVDLAQLTSAAPSTIVRGVPEDVASQIDQILTESQRAKLF